MDFLIKVSTFLHASFPDLKRFKDAITSGGLKEPLVVANTKRQWKIGLVTVPAIPAPIHERPHQQDLQPSFLSQGPQSHHTTEGGGPPLNHEG